MGKKFRPPVFKNSGKKRDLSSFGLQVNICKKCGSFNPCDANDPKPEKCSQCGERL